MPNFPRKKPFRLWLSLSYRLYKLSNAILGPERVLKILLNGHFIFHRLSWESIASLYKEAENSNENMPQLMQRWITPGSRIVDIGCGSGRLSIEATKYGSVVGIDHAATSRKDPRVDFRVGDAMAVDEKFDVAILSHILEHLDDPDALLSQLKVETILVEVPNFNYDGRNAYREKLGLPFYSDNDHVREYVPEELTRLLERNGWTVKELVVNDAISVVAVR